MARNKQKKQKKEEKCTCDPGKHIEKIEYPKVPRDELAPQNRIKKMEEIPGAADPFEVAAAKHDHKEGDITKGEQLSRGPDDSQKIWAVCKKNVVVIVEKLIKLPVQIILWKLKVEKKALVELINKKIMNNSLRGEKK